MKIPTYCINLERRKDRRFGMIDEFARLETLNYEFITAVDGDDIPFSDWERKTFNKPQVYACLLSHIRAIEKFYQSKQKFGLICEDDVHFCKDFDKRISDVFEKNQILFDILYLGFFPTPNHKNIVSDNNNFFLMNGQKGAFAYILTNHSARDILREMRKLKEPADFCLSRYHKDSISYCMNPFSVYVKSDYSDLSGHHVDYKNIYSLYKDEL